MYPKMHMHDIYWVFFKELIKLEYLEGEGGGGGRLPIFPTLLSIQVYYYVIAIYTTIFNLYYIFVYMFM